MSTTLRIAPPDPDTLRVAEQAFLAVQRGAGTGDWSSFVDLLADDVRIMIPVPADVFSFEIAGGRVASMYEYATWTAKHPTSRWADVTFAREAFGESLAPA